MVPIPKCLYSARQHGLLCFKSGQEVWVDGVQTTQLTCPEALVRVIEEANVFGQQNKQALDFFSGTGSVAKVLEEWGYEVITIDFAAKWNPTMCVDIMAWNYTTITT